jgi:hypothetical protein
MLYNELRSVCRQLATIGEENIVCCCVCVCVCYCSVALLFSVCVAFVVCCVLLFVVCCLLSVFLCVLLCCSVVVPFLIVVFSLSLIHI